MRALLWERWDPLALRPHGAPEDEYDAYAGVLASKLRRGSSCEDIAAYLGTALAEDGGVTPIPVADCEQTAQALLDWYGRSGAPR